MIMSKISEKEKYFLMLLFVVVIALFIFNSSPIYIGIEENDSAVFQIIGQGILNGKMPYRDLFDHKGPVQYIIQVIAILFNSFTFGNGLFLVEVLFMYLAVIYIYKLMKLFSIEKAYPIIFLVYSILYVLAIEGGNFTEEYAISIMMVALYYIIRILKFGRENKWDYYVLGIGFALCFLIKPTYIYLWAAFGITAVIYYCRKKEFALMFRNMLFALLGALTIILPIFIWLFANNAFMDFINAVFITNMKYSSGSIKERIVTFIFLSVFKYYCYFWVLAIIEILVIITNKNENIAFKMLVILFTVFTVIFASFAPNMYSHYLLQQIPLLVLLYVLLLQDFFKIKKVEKICKFVLVILIGLLGYSIYSSNNVISIKGQKYNYANIENVRLIQKYVDGDSEDKLLVLGNQPQYYLAMNIEPNIKYFFQSPICKYVDEVEEKTLEYIKEKKPSVVINYFEEEYLEEGYFEEIVQFVNENYYKCAGIIGTYYVLRERKF